MKVDKAFSFPSSTPFRTSNQTQTPGYDMEKKQYNKPTLQTHGTVELITGYTAGHDVFGGGFLSQGAKCKAKKQGPADFGS